MFLSISDDAFFTCIGIAVDTEMATSIIHSNIFTHHTSANLALTGIFYIFRLLRDWRKILQTYLFPAISSV